jgi:FKBP-type peptidyl-prolyl cis-trans isomerase
MALAPAGPGVVSLPGLQYQVLRSGSTDGPRPRRSDDVMFRYAGQLTDGSIFSTSANNGAEPSSFSVRTVIPGFSALVHAAGRPLAVHDPSLSGLWT